MSLLASDGETALSEAEALALYIDEADDKVTVNSANFNGVTLHAKLKGTTAFGVSYLVDIKVTKITTCLL